MTTTIRTDLISETAISFMRTMSVAYSVTGAKPNTRLFAFFDGVSVDHLITPTAGVRGGSVVTNSAGDATGLFFVPPVTFATGTKNLKFQDEKLFSQSAIPGSTTSSAAADFTSRGMLSTNRNLVTDRIIQTQIVTVENNVLGLAPPPPPPPAPPAPPPLEVVFPAPPAPPPPPPEAQAQAQVEAQPVDFGFSAGDFGGGAGDPLAQSFFTFGVAGGVSISAIDVYVQSKPPNGDVPLTIEIRELINGYPGPRLVSRYARVSINPENISVSNTALVPTTFVFDSPIFLPEDKEFCFVLLTNTDKYLVWTAKIGENSQENGQTIFEQPFIGSMFKSENNITWTVDQTEDIKFRIHKAVFSTTGATASFRARPPKLLMYGTNMTVTSGSNVVRVRFDHLHGLRNGDKFRLLAPAGASTYRGVSAANMTGLFNVVFVDEYNITIQLAAGSFTSSGLLPISGIVNDIQVDIGGSGYTNPTLTIVGTNTTQATATAVVTGGSITGVIITNPGAGYTTKPTVQITGSGSGASLFLVSEAVFEIETNRVFDEVLPRVASIVPALSSLNSTLKVTTPEYVIQGAVASRNNVLIVPARKSIVVSADNKATFTPGQETLEFTMNLATQSSAVSPIVVVSENPLLECHAFVINNQTTFETITTAVTRGEGSLASININVGGSGYASTAITISAPDLSTGVQATAVAVLTGGVVTGVTITNVGSGYTKPPSVVMGTVVASPATLVGVLTPFNTEILPRGGSARSRYVTKQLTLATASRGAVIFTSAYSQSMSSFDFYIRTSSKAGNVNHAALPWRLMTCDVPRNASTKVGEYMDYQFYINGLPPFDVYDLKIVLRSSDRTNIPMIDNYRCIILAT